MSAIIIRMCRVIVLYFCFFYFSIRIFNFSYAFKLYTRVIEIITFLIILQYLLYYIFEVDVNMLIPTIKLNYGDGVTSDDLMYKWHLNATIGYYRPSTLFLEPVYQAHYTLPWIAMILFSNTYYSKNTSIYKVIVVSIGVLLTTSSLGIIGCIAIWIVSICKNIFCGKISKKFLYLIPLLLALVSYILSQESIQNQINGKFQSLSDITEVSSTTLRLFRGLLCFRQMDLVNQIFGYGYGNIVAFFTQEGIRTVLDTNLSVISYMNSASTLLCSLGIIGFALYLVAMLPFFIISKREGKGGLLVTMILFAATSSVFDAPVYFLMVTFLVTHETKRIQN